MKPKLILTTTAALLIIAAAAFSIAQTSHLSARVKALENAQSVQLARARVLISAMERAESRSDLVDTAKLLVAVLEPNPQAAVSALDSGN
jgi:hypothetical protein